MNVPSPPRTTLWTSATTYDIKGLANNNIFARINSFNIKNVHKTVSSWICYYTDKINIIGLHAKVEQRANAFEKDILETVKTQNQYERTKWDAKAHKPLSK